MSETPFDDPTIMAPPEGASGGSQAVAPADPGLVQALRGFGPGHQVFGRFTLSRELGKGGMGVVWLARDQRLDLDVALKFLAGIVTSDAEALQDLRREITRGLTLTHPGIVRMFDLHEEAGLAAIAMEYVPGSTLTDVKNARPDRCFDPGELHSWVRELCEVLAYVHEKAKVVHRDLKPRNLMLNAEGELKVTDFGIAATLTDSHSRLTNVHTSGTPAYMSPQQASGYRPTASDDIYALGATLYELLTSKPPFFRGAGVSLLHQLLHEPAPTMEARREELGVTDRAPIPGVWEQTIAACLAKEPEGRPASVREVARRLFGEEELVDDGADDQSATVMAPAAAPIPSRDEPIERTAPPSPPAPTYLPPPRQRRPWFGHFMLFNLLAVALSMPCAWYLSQLPHAATPAAATLEPASEPMLTIETGMHTAMIYRVATDARGILVLTASKDKTARLWNSTGKLLQVLRPPTGPEREGELNAGDLSPDGGLAAVGGHTGLRWDKTASVYLFDTASGRLVRRFKDFPSQITELAFSPDGKMLAVGLVQWGFRVVATDSGEMLADEHASVSEISGLRFSPDGTHLVVTNWDGEVRLFATPKLKPDGKPLQLLASEKKAGVPCRPSFNPKGDLLALGSDENAATSVVSGQDLKFAFSPWKPGAKTENLRSVAWSQDGQSLAAGGIFRRGPTDMFVHVWNQGGRGDMTEWVVSTGGITDLHAAPRGGFYFSSYDPSWGLLDAQGHATTFGKSPLADTRMNLLSFSVSSDASVVSFGFVEHGQKPAQFSLLERKLTLAGPGETTISDPRLHPPKTTGLPIKGWRNGEKVKLKGEVLSAGVRNRALAISADESFFVIATENGLQCFDAEGNPRWSAALALAITGLNLSNDGKIVAASYGDGRIRWFSAQDGRQLLTFFPHADQQRWVAWTPEGYYDTSALGEELVGWVVNQGKDREAAWYPAAKYRDKYYRPDIVARALDVSAAAQAKPSADAR